MAVQRYSFQREKIYECVCGTTEHPTAQMVYDWLHAEMPKLSLGTVYRNLHQMAEEGRLLELDGPVARFDAQLRPHTHARCAVCGCVADVDLPYDAALDRAVEQEGWNVSGHSLIFMGICPACAGENKNHEI